MESEDIMYRPISGENVGFDRISRLVLQEVLGELHWIEPF